MNKIQIDNINNYSEEEINNIYQNIQKEKQIEIDHFQNNNRKKQSIIGQKLLMDTLKEEYKKVTITKNKYGKPYLNNNIYFNISHTNEYVVLVTSDKEIGIDIEKIREKDLKEAKFFTTEQEYNYIINSKNPQESFWTIYTLKEAYIKMKGTNFNDCQNVSFEIENSKVLCSDKKVEAKVHLSIPNYIIATCEYK